MKKLIYAILAAALMNNAIAYTVPFDNVQLNPNATLSANYSFGSNAIIFCYTPSLATTGVITWPYQSVIESGSLPMPLTNNPNATGQLANSNGTITIKNTLTSAIVVSCDFAF
jgi:hypothetical protein